MIPFLEHQPWLQVRQVQASLGANLCHHLQGGKGAVQPQGGRQHHLCGKESNHRLY